MQRTFNFDDQQTSTTKKRKKSEKPIAKVIEIPPRLAACPEFIIAWNDWLAYRRSEKKKPVSDSLAKRQLRHFDECGCVASIAAIRESMRQGWTGVFPKPAKVQSDLLSPVDRWLKETDQ